MSDAIASHEDAQLVLRLYELRREDRMRKAREWFQFDFNPESMADIKAILQSRSEENTSFRMVTSYWDMAASFAVHGTLNAELLLESSNEMILVWAKLQPFIAEIREFGSLPAYLENIEKMMARVGWAQERVRWMQDRVRQYHESVKKMGTEPKSDT